MHDLSWPFSRVSQISPGIDIIEPPDPAQFSTGPSLGSWDTPTATLTQVEKGVLIDLDLKDLPPQIRDIMRAAYGDATAEIFMISAIVGILALVAVLFIKEKPLRRTVDLQPEASAAV